VYLAPRPSPSLLSQLKALGTVKTLLLGDSSHETFAAEFVAQFSGGLDIVAPARFKKEHELAGFTVTRTLEEALPDLQKQWGLERVHTDDFVQPQVSIDCLQFRRKDQSNVLIMACGYGNTPFWTMLWKNPAGILAGFAGLRVFRLFRLTFVRSKTQARAYWNRLQKVENLSCVSFFHGVPIQGNIKKQMEGLKI
jgi:hypothetical protein